MALNYVRVSRTTSPQNCVFAVRAGGDVLEKSDYRISKSEGVPNAELRKRSLAVSVRISYFELRISHDTGVVAERAFVAQRLTRVNVAFDEEVCLPAPRRRQAVG